MPNYYPLMLDVRGRRAIVLGGDRVAAEKAAALSPPAYGTYIRLAALVRTYLRKSGISYDRRDEFFSDFFTSDVLGRLVKGDTEQATVITAALLLKYGIGIPADVLEAALEEE